MSFGESRVGLKAVGDLLLASSFLGYCLRESSGKGGVLKLQDFFKRPDLPQCGQCLTVQSTFQKRVSEL